MDMGMAGITFVLTLKITFSAVIWIHKLSYCRSWSK